MNEELEKRISYLENEITNHSIRMEHIMQHIKELRKKIKEKEQ